MVPLPVEEGLNRDAKVAGNVVLEEAPIQANLPEVVTEGFNSTLSVRGVLSPPSRSLDFEYLREIELRPGATETHP